MASSLMNYLANRPAYRPGCRHCPGLKFDSFEELLKHQQVEMDQNHGHDTCSFCNSSVEYERDEIAHHYLEAAHKDSANLKCPGCPRKFEKVDVIIKHWAEAHPKHRCRGFSLVLYNGAIQGNIIRTIDIANATRPKVLEIMAQLPNVNLTNPPPKSYAFHVNMQVERTPIPSEDPTQEEIDQANANWNDPNYVYATGVEVGAFAAFTAQQNKFANPDHPSFTAAHAWDEKKQIYCCLHQGCSATAVTEELMIEHLRSIDHRAISRRRKGGYYCHNCMKDFPTPWAVTAHIESAASTGKACIAYKTDEHPEYMRQLTGGLIDVVGTRMDGSYIYEVASNAMSLLRPSPMQRRLADEARSRRAIDDVALIRAHHVLGLPPPDDEEMHNSECSDSEIGDDDIEFMDTSADKEASSSSVEKQNTDLPVVPAAVISSAVDDDNASVTSSIDSDDESVFSGPTGGRNTVAGPAVVNKGKGVAVPMRIVGGTAAAIPPPTSGQSVAAAGRSPTGTGGGQSVIAGAPMDTTRPVLPNSEPTTITGQLDKGKAVDRGAPSAVINTATDTIAESSKGKGRNIETVPVAKNKYGSDWTFDSIGVSSKVAKLRSSNDVKKAVVSSPITAPCVHSSSIPALIPAKPDQNPVPPHLRRKAKNTAPKIEDGKSVTQDALAIPNGTKTDIVDVSTEDRRMDHEAQPVASKAATVNISMTGPSKNASVQITSKFIFSRDGKVGMMSIKKTDPTSAVYIEHVGTEDNTLKKRRSSLDKTTIPQWTPDEQSWCKDTEAFGWWW